MAVVEGVGIPLGSPLTSASPAEVKLAESRRLPGLPCPALAARGRSKGRFASSRIELTTAIRCAGGLTRRGILLISPHRKGRRKPPLQDGRALRRYRRRWKIERTFAWLGKFRRLVVRYDNQLLMYQAFFHVACLITLRYL